MATNSLNSTDDLATIFNDCLERMASGQSLDDCLAMYPRYATQLRALLEARAAVRRARATPQEVAAAQERIRFRLQGYNRRASPSFDIRRISGIAVLLLVLLLAGFGVQQAITYLNQPTATLTAIPSATLTPTVTMTVSATHTATSTTSPTITASVTASATLTPSFTSTPSMTATSVDVVQPTAPRPTPIPTRRPTISSNPPNPPPPTDDHGGRGGDDHGGKGNPGPGGGSGSGRGGGDD